MSLLNPDRFARVSAIASNPLMTTDQAYSALSLLRDLPDAFTQEKSREAAIRSHPIDRDHSHIPDLKNRGLRKKQKNTQRRKLDPQIRKLKVMPT